MWVKRSHEELEQTKRRKKFGGIIFVFGFATLWSVIGIFKTGGWEMMETGRVFVPSEERLTRLPGLFLSGLVLGILCIVLRPRPEVVCPKCGKIERKNRFTKCECGGYFEHLHEMKWIDEK